MRYTTCLLLLLLQLAAFAQDFEPYIPEEGMPDVVNILPAPPKDPSPEFDHDVMRYMWGKMQRRDSLRLEMAVRDSVWNAGHPFGAFRPQDFQGRNACHL